MKINTLAALVAVGLFAGGAFAQPVVKSAPAPLDPKVAECRAKNQAEHKSIVDMYQKAKAGGKIDPKEAEAFRLMEARLNKHAAFLARDGFSMADCATMAKDLDSEKAAVTRMASTAAAPGTAVPPGVPSKGGPVDPKVAECRAKNQAEHKSIVDMYQKAKAGGKIDPKEAQAFATMEGRLNKHAAFLARDGFSMADCATMAKDLETEKAAVTRMASTAAAPGTAVPPGVPSRGGPVDPKVAECRAKNQAEHKSIVDMYQKAKAGGKIDPKEAQAFAAMEARLNKHAQFLARDGFSMADCATMAKDLETEKAAVTRMASTAAAPGTAVPPGVPSRGGPVDPKVAECRAKNQAEHKSIVDMYQKAKAGGKIDPKEAQAFAALEGNLKRHQAFLARDGFSMADCATMAKDLEREKAAVEKMAGLPAAAGK